MSGDHRDRMFRSPSRRQEHHKASLSTSKCICRPDLCKAQWNIRTVQPRPNNGPNRKITTHPICTRRRRSTISREESGSDRTVAEEEQPILFEIWPVLRRIGSRAMSSAFSGDETAPFFGFLGAAAALVFSCTVLRTLALRLLYTVCVSACRCAIRNVIIIIVITCSGIGFDSIGLLYLCGSRVWRIYAYAFEKLRRLDWMPICGLISFDYWISCVIISFHHYRLLFESLDLQ